MMKFLFWLKNCVMEKNRGCSGYCGTCRYYSVCSHDGLEKSKQKVWFSKHAEVLNVLKMKETI